MRKTWLVWGCIFAFLAVALGAFGAHILKERIDEHDLDIFQTGVQYMMYHALALIGLGLASDKLSNEKSVLWAGRLFVAGIFLFSGSLYALTLSGIGVLGAITPIGGVAFLAGWALFGSAAWKQK